MANEGPEQQTVIRSRLFVINQQTGQWIPLAWNTEGGVAASGIPVSFPAYVKTDLDNISTQQTTIATQTTTIATQTTTIATQTTTIATNTGTLATNSTSEVTQGQLRPKGTYTLTNSNADAFTAGSNLTNVSVALANSDSSARSVTLTHVAGVGTLTLLPAVSIPANTTLAMGEFGMLSGEKLQAFASVGSVVYLSVYGAAN